LVSELASLVMVTSGGVVSTVTCVGVRVRVRVEQSPGLGLGLSSHLG